MSDGLLALIVGYLLGSLPFGYWAGRLKGVDLRTVGSGNTGGTNAVRVLGPKVGVPVIVLDIAKGAVAAWIGGEIGGADAAVLASVAAVLGHAFPFWLGFRGGKAVATGAGTMLALVPWIGVTVFVIWILVGLATRYVSVASIVAAFSYSVLVHVLQFASTVLLGLYFFLKENLTLSELRAEASTATGSESGEH